MADVPFENAISSVIPSPVNLKYPSVKFCESAVKVIVLLGDGVAPAASYVITLVAAVNATVLESEPCAPCGPSLDLLNVYVFVNAVPVVLSVIVIVAVPVSLATAVGVKFLWLLTVVPRNVMPDVDTDVLYVLAP